MLTMNLYAYLTISCFTFLLTCQGLDQLRSGLLQQQKPFIQAPQPFHQLQMLTPQHQQQLMLAQQNLTSPAASDDSRRLRMLLSNRNMGLGKDGLTNSVSDVVPNVGSPLQSGSTLMPRGDPDMLIKLKMAQLQQQQQQQQQQNSNPQQQQQQLQQHVLSNQQSQSSNHNLHPQDKMGVLAVSMSMVSKNQTGRKRKQPVSSSGPANSSGTANTAGPSPSSAPSTPSTHTTPDVISMPLPHSGGSSKPFMFGPDGTGTLTSPSNQLWDDKDLELQADMDRFEDGSLEENVDSFLSHDDTDPRDAVPRMDVSKDCVDAFLNYDGIIIRMTSGFTFTELHSIRASASKVVCCHFSSDGKMLASGGHDKKVILKMTEFDAAVSLSSIRNAFLTSDLPIQNVEFYAICVLSTREQGKQAVLWYTDNLKPKTTLEEHSSLITDVRFSPSMPRLATSSFDKTVRVWDADNPNFSLRTFTGHNNTVMSLDFHPNKDDLICSCDGDGEIRYWSITNGSCTRVFKGGMTQMRFQPRVGRYLAAAAENVVSILDVETQACRHSLQGHTKQIHSVCWDPSGDYLASVSEDSVRVWTLGSGSEGECVHDLKSQLQSVVPMLIVDLAAPLSASSMDPFVASFSNQESSLELWNMSENKTMTLPAHEGLIAALAVSTATGLVASASHDKFVKLWK
ncbi:unnamed protein product [Dovyalis caffra]|uniref:Transcriptional corepressor LEUNIG n=1 Tax=Dovyalis caffra TaxID=77055 RepID=A0AAV1SPE8_9ROSI|nr:unnamed protein product [Dovyalis caffra]